MRSRHAVAAPAMLISIACFIGFSGADAHNHVVTIRSGEVHLRGSLAEGSCVVSTESQDMQVNMGQYRDNNFHGAGTLSSVRVPFTLYLTDCNPSLVGEVGVSFYGITDPNDADVFLVNSGNGLSDGEGYSGLGLMLSDETGHQVIPNQATETAAPINDSEVVMNYVARYRATSHETWPGALRSEVWFKLVYP